jgi:hypothetical protein
MFGLHVVVAGIVMFNIMELIMKIMPNSPTKYSIKCSLFWFQTLVPGTNLNQTQCLTMSVSPQGR